MAWDRLKKEYGQTKEVVNAHMDEIINLIPVRGSNKHQGSGILRDTFMRFKPSKKAKSCTEQSNKMAPKENFTWTDEELRLLLDVINDYKAEKASSGLDWETVKNKYEHIRMKFTERYPNDGTEGFPNGEDASVFTKERSPAVESIPEGLESSAEAGDVTGEVSDPENSILTCSSAQEDDTSPGTSNETLSRHPGGT
ncbi:hypothetical protein OS493_035242 [Desmophyllum pertusum]|uniref:Uncharacterized protein n=1 Tax=Desmophyllum pertusum TaxID=174260 RepID=A0A9W9ZIZ4_9CNID|nr:hypothetical protein OS493_035242 [Desmophyllum pertusum]